jgi:chemotaxis protein methyltransferase CheR
MTLSELAMPIFPSNPLEQVTDAELHDFAELIYKRTGIRVSPQKKMLLSNRLRRRLRRTGIRDFGQYYRHLQSLQPDDAEWDAFLQEITTHETYLFRDEAQWKWFREGFLPQWAADARAGKHGKTLSIWSAACSTGDEAVTAACCIADCLPDFERWKIEVLGTDIGVGAVEQARAGVYGQRAMHSTPDEYRKRFFIKTNESGVWRIKPALRQMLGYRRHNLLDPMPAGLFDLIILKNVLIYFDAASKRTVLKNVRAALRSGGLLMASATECVGELLKDFPRMEPWLYRKPSQQRV